MEHIVINDTNMHILAPVVCDLVYVRVWVMAAMIMTTVAKHDVIYMTSTTKTLIILFVICVT